MHVAEQKMKRNKSAFWLQVILLCLWFWIYRRTCRFYIRITLHVFRYLRV